MEDITSELREIGRIISSASLLLAVRKEVADVMKRGFVVTDGKHQPGALGYDVVVKCGEENTPEVSRRIRSGVPDIRIEELTEGVLGIKSARRGR